MFAEDAGLLPDKLFTQMLEASRANPAEFQEHASTLFRAMAHKGGRVGFKPIDWFNGGLFDDDQALPLGRDDIDQLILAAKQDWSQIDPSIMGTLFERGLDPDKRSQLGAHYTDRDKIMMIVDPVIVRPLTAEWEEVRERIVERLVKAPQRTADKLLTPAQRNQQEKARREAQALLRGYLERLASFRVLDPACGSGNFLYLSLLALKDLEHRANIEAEELGLQRELPMVGPQCVLGIELNPYAAELARVSVWIGEIQWMRRHGYEAGRNPILKKLDTIECRDAVLSSSPTVMPGSTRHSPSCDATEEGGQTPDQVRGDSNLASPARAQWPNADVIVGNPPFLGGKRLRAELGDEYVSALFSAYRGLVPQEADLVAYWVAKAWAAVISGGAKRAGLVTTNSMRGGANRRVLAPVADAGGFFEAWSDQPWTVEGAAVRVSLLTFAARAAASPNLDGRPVERINADLTGASADLTKATRLVQNAAVAFMGDTKGGPFDISGTFARELLALPSNPNGRPNTDVLRPWVNGMDVTSRRADKWIIDFGCSMGEHEAALYEAPFAYVFQHVKPERTKNRRETYARNWWRHVEARQGMVASLSKLQRFILTPRVSKHRLFVWLPSGTLPDSATIAIARDDETTFGILHSRFHEIWALRMGTSLEDRPRYTPSTTFETFPFPEGLTPNIRSADYADDPRAQKIAAAAARLNELRENWLNPPDLVRCEPEIVPGYPDRILPVSEEAARELKKRTLTNLYNARPAWLDQAHRALDEAVAEAYDWGEDWRAGLLTDDEILARLFRLNQERAGLKEADSAVQEPKREKAA